MEQQLSISGSGVRRRTTLNRRSLNHQRDIPILILIRNSVVITRNQIDTLLLASANEGTRPLNRRLARLCDLGQIREHPQVFPFTGRVFSITAAGLETLEVVGLGIMSITSESEKLMEDRQILHYLMLNQIQERLHSHVAILNWWGDRLLKSLNLAANEPTVKDYDAVAEVVVPSDKTVRIGIEYERTQKSRARYAEIRRAIAQETAVRTIIYFTSTQEIALVIAGEVYSPSVPVLIIVAGSFFESGLDCPVLFRQGTEIRTSSLRQLLNSL